jgi:hypothetical protein
VPLCSSANGTVYIAFGSNGLSGDYHGWLFGYDARPRCNKPEFSTSPPTPSMGGIWQSGGGPSADSEGNVFAGDGRRNCSMSDRTSASNSYSDSFLRFGWLGGLSSVADYFTPCDQATLQSRRPRMSALARPFSCRIPRVLPSEPDLLIGGSKAARSMSSTETTWAAMPPPLPGVLDSESQTIPVGAGPILSTPLFWNNAVYVAPANGTTMNPDVVSPVRARNACFSPRPLRNRRKFWGPQGGHSRHFLEPNQ